MTTIATDGKTMAGDGQRNHCGSITNTRAVKVRKLSDGTLVGTSGDVPFGELVVAWLEKGGEPPKLENDGGFTALIVRPDGDVQIVGQDCRPSSIEPPFAVGSGMDLAIGAMAMGASPKRAVEIASRYDQRTGGQITELERTIRLEAAA